MWSDGAVEMSSQLKPSYQANVSPGLIRLRRALANATTAARAAFDGTASPDPVLSTDMTQQMQTSAFRPVTLRQDGTRPLKIIAALVLTSVSALKSMTVPALTATRTIRLYATPDGALTAQVEVAPGQSCPLRPVWRVKQILSIEDLHALHKQVAQAFALLAPQDRVDQVKSLSEAVRAVHPPLFARI